MSAADSATHAAITKKNSGLLANPYLVPFDGGFHIGRTATAPPADAPGDKACKRRLEEAVAELAVLQKVLFAGRHHAILLVFQAMDAAGKDGTIRSLLTGVNPAGCHVHPFQKPTAEEIDHDFLWRTSLRLPARGHIGVFNRSHYEEVLVVRVHPELLIGQRLPAESNLEQLWWERYESIVEYEKHLARSGTLILKFFLHVSPAEQKKRLLERLRKPETQWKFDAGDLDERGHWAAYQQAYEDALRATSRSQAPWFAIPADDKAYMRMVVAETVVQALQDLDMTYPQPSRRSREEIEALRARLEAMA